MKIIKRIIGVVALSVLCAHADFTPTSRFFLNPDTGVGLIKKGADFWRNYKDATNGGFNHYYVNTDGTRPSGLSYDYKYFSPQSRLGYVFARAFMVTGDTTYLDDADHALQFLYKYGWDVSPDTGGWFYRAKLDGSGVTGLSSYGSSSRWSYMQHYALLGPTTVFEAQGGQRFARNAKSPNHWDWITKGLEFNEQKLWDSRPGLEGYYNYYYPTTGAKTGKGFTPTVDAITTHADNLSLITGESKFLDRLTQHGNAMVEHMVGSMDSTKTYTYPSLVTLPAVAMGMPEEFGADWQLGSTYAMVGHTIKTVWCLGRVYMQSPQAKYVTAAERVFDSAWVQGLVDTVRGGVYYDYSYNYKTAPTTRKNYWMLEQGFNAGVMLARLTSDPLRRERALRMAQGSVDFFYTYLNQANGSAVLESNRDGVFDPAYAFVGDEWDAGYHASEFAWLVYLYGNLLNDRKTVSLYYKLAASSQAQQIRLSPLRLPGDSLAIYSVQKNGQPFSNFVPNSRTLKLAAGEAGVFRVTYGYRNAATDAASSVVAAPLARGVQLQWDSRAQALRLEVATSEHLRIQTVNSQGQVELWANQEFDAGTHTVRAPRPVTGMRWLLVRSAEHTWTLPLAQVL